MLGGERSSGTSLAHAQELIAQAVAVDGGAPAPRGRRARAERRHATHKEGS